MARRRAAAVAASKWKQKSSDEESEWEEESGGVEDSEEEEFEEENVESDDDIADTEQEEVVEKKVAARPKKAAPSKSRKRKRSKVADSDDDEDDFFLSKEERLTAKGGYIHTKKMRLKISRANKGNTPWNKGLTRNEATKAKISAGVKARNRALLLPKLKKLGITEEQYQQKRKEIKFVREKLRIAKRRTAEEQKRQAEFEKKKKPVPVPAQGGELSEEEELEEIAKTEPQPEPEPQPEKPKSLQLPPIFAPDITWKSHAFDTEEDDAYQNLCKSGGPGGLICCASCAASFSQYMTQTAQDMEVQRAENVSKEIQELMGFVKESQKVLQQTIRTARRQPPPPRPSAAKTASATSRKAGKRPPAPSDWHATSTIDIKGLGPTTRI